jgi:hypothetical protein
MIFDDNFDILECETYLLFKIIILAKALTHTWFIGLKSCLNSLVLF